MIQRFLCTNDHFSFRLSTLNQTLSPVFGINASEPESTGWKPVRRLKQDA